MDEQSLQLEINHFEQAQARIREIAEQHSYDQLRQLQFQQRALQMANTQMMSIRRYLIDTQNRIQSNPALLKQFASLMKSGDKDPMKTLIMQESGGQDLQAMYQAAAMNVQNIRQQGFAQFGNATGTNTSPLVDKAIDSAMPFAVRAPEDQQKILGDYANKIKSGTPIDMKEVTTSGVPIGSIAQQLGVSIDPISGMVQKIGQPAPGASSPMQINQPGVMPLAAARGAAALFGGGGQAAPAPVAASAQTPPVASAVQGPGAADAQAQPARFQQILRMSSNLPDAEQAARALLDMGVDYNTVIQAAPQGFQQMLSAKLPKRIPTKPLPMPQIGSPQPAPAQPNQLTPQLGNPFTPANALAPSRPLFTPPGV
jgi:hypothetical protein